MSKLLSKLKDYIKKNKRRSVLFLIGVFLAFFIAEVTIDELNKPEFTSYPKFLETVQSGGVDIVYYDPAQEDMVYVLGTSESKDLTLDAKEKYNYPKENYKSTVYPATEAFREEMLKAGVLVRIKTDKLMSITLMSIGLRFGFISLICYCIYKVISSFVSKTPTFDSQSTNIGFDDVIGHDEVISDLKLIVKLMKDPIERASLGTSVPKGILFSGDPGTGKTLIAKALAGESNIPFIYANASSFIEVYAGTGAKRVRDLFYQARKLAPCILFIDEIDSIGSERGRYGSNSEDLQTINALLQEMDGFSTTSGVLVIGATNNAKGLDSALLRAGRFDRQIEIMPPRDWKARRKLFEHFLGEVDISNIDLDLVSKETVGFTGADIQAVVNEAKLVRIQRDTPTLDTDCIEEAIDKKVFKGNRKPADKENKDREVIAYHEAGHATMMYLVGEKIARVSIIGTSSGVGGMVVKSNDDGGMLTKSELENSISIAYAGRCSERIKFDRITSGASNDITEATRLINLYVDRLGFDTDVGMLDITSMTSSSALIDKELFARKSELAKRLEQETLTLLTSNYHLVEALAGVLLERETLCGEEVISIFSNAKNSEV